MDPEVLLTNISDPLEDLLLTIETGEVPRL